jgi:hypothetical protein
MQHEHQRPDRDTYLKINWQNIDPNYKSQFEIPAPGSSRKLGEYDFASIMHYSADQLSVNNGDTFTLKVQPPEGVVPGEGTTLSAGDVAGMRLRYCKPANWTIQPKPLQAEGNGGAYAISITAPPYCTWTASETTSWLMLPTTTKTGPGSITVTVLADFGESRTGSIRVQSGTVATNILVHQEADPHNSRK